MNWYKKAQSLSQIQNPDLTLQPDSFSSALPQSQEAMEKLGLEKMLEEFAKEKGYEEPLDYALCSLFPELEQECRAFYVDRENKLVDLHPKRYIKQVDNTVAAGLLRLYRERQKMLGEI